MRELGAKCPRQPHQGNDNPMLGHSAGVCPGKTSRHRSRLMTCLPATPPPRSAGKRTALRPTVGYMGDMAVDGTVSA